VTARFSERVAGLPARERTLAERLRRDPRNHSSRTNRDRTPIPTSAFRARISTRAPHVLYRPSRERQRLAASAHRMAASEISRSLRSRIPRRRPFYSRSKNKKLTRNFGMEREVLGSECRNNALVCEGKRGRRNSSQESTATSGVFPTST
jgi:hypothetical protein